MSHPSIFFHLHGAELGHLTLNYVSNEVNECTTTPVSDWFKHNYGPTPLWTCEHQKLVFSFCVVCLGTGSRSWAVSPLSGPGLVCSGKPRSPGYIFALGWECESKERAMELLDITAAWQCSILTIINKEQQLRTYVTPRSIVFMPTFFTEKAEYKSLTLNPQAI